MDKLLAFSIGTGATPTYTLSVPSVMPQGDILASIVTNAITILLIIVGVFALFSIIFSGLQWIMSGGEKEKLEKARKRLVFSIIGLLIAFLSFFIINLVQTEFGIKP